MAGTSTSVARAGLDSTAAIGLEAYLEAIDWESASQVRFVCVAHVCMARPRERLYVGRPGWSCVCVCVRTQ